MIISGYIPFDVPSNYYYDETGPYRVILHRDCLKETDLSECITVSCHNEDPIRVLSHAPETRLKVKPYGLFYESELIRNDLPTRALIHDINNGFMKGSSLKYSFLPHNQETRKVDGERIVTMKRLLCLEHVGPVFNPAYPGSWVKVGPLVQSTQLLTTNNAQ
jgi:phage head maturation protease